MGSITVNKKINYPASMAWSFIADYANISKIHPMLTNSFINEGSMEKGLGAERSCQMPAGMNLVEEVIDWQEGESYTIRVVRTNMPIKTAQATIGVRSLRSQGANRAEIFFKMIYKVKWGILGKLMDLLMMRWMLLMMVGMLLNSLTKEVAKNATTPTAI